MVASKDIANNGTRRVVIEPVTRVEGHGKVTILLDEAGKVSPGPPAHRRVSRLRAVHPGASLLGSPRAGAAALRHLPGQPPPCRSQGDGPHRRRREADPTAEKMRRLMHYGQMFQSHALHFFHLCSPDLLFGFDADPAIRNVIGVRQAQGSRGAGHDDAQVRSGAHQGHGRQEDARHRGDPRRHEQEPQYHRARRVPAKTSTRCSVVAGRGEGRQGLHGRDIWRRQEFGERSTRTTCR
jgi:hypothetical protein